MSVVRMFPGSARPVGLLWLLLGSAWAQGCVLAVTSDSGVDGAVDDAGGAEDSGLPDSGWERPVFGSCEGVLVAVPERPSECGCQPRQNCVRGSCTWECVACSSLSPCSAGWTCDFISPPYCEGVCRRALMDCPQSLTDELVLMRMQVLFLVVRAQLKSRHALVQA